jgi:hypothetical protein
MKGYQVLRKDRALIFACDKCPFRVELEKFGVPPPLARTLGAAEMNDHMAKEHFVWKAKAKDETFGIK